MLSPHHAVIGMLAAALCAQEPAQPPERTVAVDLEPLRAHFAKKEKGGVQWVAAWVGDREPVVLTHGTDAGGQDLAASTLLPLGSLIRLLVADAVAAAGPANVLDEIAVTVGGHDLTVGELLRGSTLVPDWFATEPTAAIFARGDVLACVEFAVQSGFRFDTDRRGVGELALLADRLLSEPGATDWPAALRTRLSPAGVGVDPIDVAVGPLARVALTKAAGEQLAGAAAAPLRLALPCGDVLRWWRWRAPRETAAAGARSGSTFVVTGYENERMRQWSPSHGGFHWCVRTFAGGNAVLLQYAADAPAVDLTPEFLELLFGPPAPPELRWGGRGGRRDPSLDAIEGTWLEPGKAARLRVGRGLFGWGLSLQVGERRYTLDSAQRTGDRYDCTLSRPRDTVADRLLVWREGERQLRCVLLEQEPFSVIPRRLDFTRAAPAGETPRDR